VSLSEPQIFQRIVTGLFLGFAAGHPLINRLL